MPQPTRLYLAADHAGFELKEQLKKARPDLPWVDLGPSDDSRVDYPDFADRLATAMKEAPGVGVLICGSGQGMAMRANRYPHLRAALCWNAEIAKLSREHNNANVLCMGARHSDRDAAQEMLRVFLDTEFEGGRHAGRVDKLAGSLC